MAPLITSVNLNDTVDTQPASGLDPVPEVLPVDDATPSTDVPNAEVADDIDTDELESLLTDLKQTKKQNKLPAKKRVRKVKAVKAEPVLPEPVVEAVVEPIVEPVTEPDVKPKRKYVRKPPATAAPVQNPIKEPVEEPPTRSPANMIEEMQKAERALRYQMRKNKMQTLITQAF